MSRCDFSTLVGATKGAFLIRGGADREGIAVAGAFCDGFSIRIHPPDAAAAVRRSRDGGKSWQDLRRG